MWQGDLLSMQAIREAKRGIAYPKDSEWQGKFESEFIYQETEDQLQVVRDIKNDMESLKPMDRLICGDVGYGKTEIAIRAAFKAVMYGKQVAVLVPTTLLAQQHYRTFTERMAGLSH
jgi:transcription-repair coupling factor (superfamily II helicase)